MAKQLERYADVLLWGLETARHKKFKRGDVVLIRYDWPALPLAEILLARTLEYGKKEGHGPPEVRTHSFDI